MDHHRGFNSLRTIFFFISAVLLVNLVEFANAKVISDDVLMSFLGCLKKNGGNIDYVIEREKRNRRENRRKTPNLFMKKSKNVRKTIKKIINAIKSSNITRHRT